VGIIAVAASGAADAVTSLTLINANTNQPIAAFDPLEDGAVLDLSTLPTRDLNIRANTSPATVGSVRFEFDGDVNFQIENVSPYALRGDTGGDYNAWTPGVGSHTVTATPYSGSGASGTAGASLTTEFTVTDSGSVDPGPAVREVLYLYGSSPPANAGHQLRLNDTGGLGFSEFGETLRSIGFTPTEMLDEDVVLDGATLAGYDVLVLSSNNRPFTAAEQTAVVEWVEAGGGLLAYSDSQFGFDAGRASDNDILQHFNMFVHHDNFAGVFTIDTFEEALYPVEGITFKGEGVSLVRVLGPPARMIARCQGGNCVLHATDGAIQPNDAALAVAEAAAGRVAVTFDRNTFFNPPGAGTNITEVDNREYLRRLMIWLAGLEPLPTDGVVTGELKKWHNVTVTFSGPWTHEAADPNPFSDYRLDVTFTHSDTGREIGVPGYYAADGNAAHSSAGGGDRWRVHFRPDAEGEWTYAASFRIGANVAISDNPLAGTPDYFDGATGSFDVGPTDKTGRDFRGKGVLAYVGEPYLRFAETGEYFLKGGADSPENFLAYYEFDQTPPDKHRYEPHAQHFQPGDPTWQDGKGQNIIGAINYLAGKGMNSVYFLTMNVAGDGRDVWPWTASDERYRFDCSKLDQWGIVFEHMERQGVVLHVLTQEQENDQLLDGGALGVQRTLYYRELIARFGHYLAITWNLGEENTNTTQQRKAFATFIKTHNQHNHAVVVHTFPGDKEAVYADLLGFANLDGPSLQDASNAVVREWRQRAIDAGHPWVVCYDEQSPAGTGVVPDSVDFWHDETRKEVLWGTLQGGGAGVEYYFGYSYPHNDLNCEDWSSRDHLWDLTRYALEFYHEHLPFWTMKPDNDLTTNRRDYTLARPGDIYAVYLPAGGTTSLAVGPAPASFAVGWFDPRHGGALRTGDVTHVTGPGEVALGNPPSDDRADWVVLVRRMSLTGAEWQVLAECLTGPGISLPGACPAAGRRFDLDRDQDLDLSDIATAQRSGPPL
jgi:hypothetical protein